MTNRARRTAKYTNENGDKTPEKIAEPEAVNHPSHYADSKIECIDAIEAATENLGGYEGMLTGCAIKYLWRWKKKAKPIEDLEKAAWYIQRLIRKLKGEANKES